MFKQFKSKHFSMLGVDIGPTSIKILELSKKAQQWCIEGYAYLKFPHNFEKNRSNDTDFLVDYLKKQLLKTKLTSKHAVIAVPDALTFRRTIQLISHLNPAELAELASIEAGKYFEHSTAELNIDYALLGPSHNQLGMNDVLLIATKKENVEQRIAVVNRAGLDVKIVETESLAISRVVRRLLARDLLSLDKVVIIYFGFVFVQLFIMKHGNTVHIEELDYAQVKKNLHDFFTTGNYAKTDYFFLAGERTDLNEIAAFLHQETGVLTKIVNPFTLMVMGKNIDSSQLIPLAPLFMIATGLAMRLDDGN